MFDVEKRFNERFHYPYVFLSEEPFSPEFQKSVRAMANGASVEFALITENWGYPEWVDKSRAQNQARDWADRNDVDADTQGYRHMVRYWAQPFADHPVLQKYRYVWRLEPGSHYTCDFVYDPLALMQSRNLMYGFAISVEDDTDAIPSLWTTTQNFMRDNIRMVLSHDNSLEWLLKRRSNSLVEFNRCQFLTNFEIVDLSFVRSLQYRKLFEYLDRTAGFYYERWSDASVRWNDGSLGIDPRNLI
ncbi:hypothetical protein FBU59_000929 [Linderina macrospora]|uniref:Uncharacterized protein n=1 Tax=Linderina macrospora TaxID=4868 RepID=A0ACC1JFQ3_9FUNG|nr:hypothetical protein FBU59_000929 [Linderina macrospora]